MKIERVCVYCASSTKIAPLFVDHATVLAEQLVANNIALVFGGSRTGLMGVMADQMNSLGGKTIGVMPRFMKEVEWNHENLSEMIWTQTMAERKEKMIENVDAVITLPGGCGTMEEFMETLSLKRLGIFTQAMIVLNSGGFYDPLEDLLAAMLRENFLGPKHRDMWTMVDDPNAILPAIREARPWDSSAQSFALVQ